MLVQSLNVFRHRIRTVATNGEVPQHKSNSADFAAFKHADWRGKCKKCISAPEREAITEINDRENYWNFRYMQSRKQIISTANYRYFSNSQFTVEGNKTIQDLEILIFPVTYFFSCKRGSAVTLKKGKHSRLLLPENWPKLQPQFRTRQLLIFF